MSIYASSFSNLSRLNSKLPAELWVRVCRHLDQANLLGASRVSTSLRAYTLSEPALWSSYSGRIAWEEGTGCRCEKFGGHRRPDKIPPSVAITTTSITDSEPWPYSFARAYAEMKLFVERSASRPFQLSLDIWCGLDMHPVLMSELVDLMTSSSL